MTKNEQFIDGISNDPDDVKPDLDEAWFAEADAFIGSRMVRRGRPRAEAPKQPVSLRLDQDVIQWFKQAGDGWQTRMNDALRQVAGL